MGPQEPSLHLLRQGRAAHPSCWRIRAQVLHSKVSGMKLSDVSDEEIRELRGWYTREMRRETQASASVRRSWQIVIAALDEVVMRRNGGKRTVLDARRMVRPGDEPLA